MRAPHASRSRAGRLAVIAALAIATFGCAISNGAPTPTTQKIAKVESPHWYQKVNPLWWIASGKPPGVYEPHSRMRRVDWFFRNPLHNFSFYVIGISDHVNSPAFRRYGRYPKDNFSPKPGWNVCEIHYHGLRLPYVAYWNRHVSFYAGWRLAGEFGLKLNFFGHPVESP
jgi:hypothetical protein